MGMINEAKTWEQLQPEVEPIVETTPEVGVATPADAIADVVSE